MKNFSKLTNQSLNELCAEACGYVLTKGAYDEQMWITGDKAKTEICLRKEFTPTAHDARSKGLCYDLADEFNLIIKFYNDGCRVERTDNLSDVISKKNSQRAICEMVAGIADKEKH